VLEYLIEGAPEGNRADPAVLDKHGTAYMCVCECLCGVCEYAICMYIMHASMVCMCVFWVCMCVFGVCMCVFGI